MRLRVAPYSTSSGSAGDGSSSCLESRILSAPLAVFETRVSPFLYFARCASRCIPGSPRLCTFRPCRRPVLGFPRISCPSAPLARPPRVCPAASHFQVMPADEFPELPRFLHLPAVPATDLRVTPILSSFGASVLEPSVALELRSTGCAS
jgi:hypothetical protein